MSKHYSFDMGSAFPPDDVVAEWIVTVAMAFNDLALVHAKFVEDKSRPDLLLYWLRLALAHYLEACLFLEETAEIEPVREFVASLPPEVVKNYELCLSIYSERKAALHQIRSVATFHYPEMKMVDGRKRSRPVQASLVELAPTRDVIRSGTVRDARLLFADTVVTSIFVRASGGSERFDDVHEELPKGIEAFMRFANPALDEYLRHKGVGFREVELVDPSDQGKGWRDVVVS